MRRAPEHETWPRYRANGMLSSFTAESAVPEIERAFEASAELVLISTGIGNTEFQWSSLLGAATTSIHVDYAARPSWLSEQALRAGQQLLQDRIPGVITSALAAQRAFHAEVSAPTVAQAGAVVTEVAQTAKTVADKLEWVTILVGLVVVWWFFG